MIRETSPANGQAQVFVSYAKVDAEQVIAIVRLLEQEGITVWRDGDRILGGQSWSEAITHAIAHSRVFVLMCSPHSLALEILLGKGGFGEVWKARHPELSNLPPVALKFCLQLDERSRKLLRHEAEMVLRAQQQLRSNTSAGISSNASGIVPLLHPYLNNDPPCLEYPYIEGGTLVRLLEEQRQSTGSLKPAQAQQIVKRVAQIVSAAHAAAPQLVHRDLKPSNILVERRPDGTIVLRVTDFGIGGLAAQQVLEQCRSTSLQENMATVLTGAYSPLYASPQQMRGDDPDPRDDVYSLGVIWYQLLTGDLASPAPTGRRWVDELLRQGMSDAAVELLSSCFERNPAHRPADAGVLADLLEKLPRSASTNPADAATELPLREGEAPSEPTLPPGAIDREGEAPPEPTLLPGAMDREGEAPSEPALPPGERTPKPARMEPRPPSATAPGLSRAASGRKQLLSQLAPSPARGGSAAPGAGSPRACWAWPDCSASSSTSRPTRAPSRSRAATPG